jgi:hypothetical protein
MKLNILRAWPDGKELFAAQNIENIANERGRLP